MPLQKNNVSTGLLLMLTVIALTACNPQLGNGLRKKDLSKNIELTTTKGIIVLRLNDSTPLHRDNFLQLVKQHFYDSILFHRVIKNFMIQAGDPNSKTAKANDKLGDGDKPYKIAPEFRETLFHKKGVLAAAREGDATNPKKESSATQFYIVQGKIFTNTGLDSVEAFRLKRKLPEAHRAVYKTLGGAPHLDMNYTIFGEVVKGIEVVDSIAAVATSGHVGGDRPLQDVKIIKARLVKRK
jgi:cyclophilin family peptidyl-prolyl cis-trans isomerase